MNQQEVFINNGLAMFKKANSWVCFDSSGRVWVEEYGYHRGDFQTVSEAICWVISFGDRD